MLSVHIHDVRLEHVLVVIDRLFALPSLEVVESARILLQSCHVLLELLWSFLHQQRALTALLHEVLGKLLRLELGGLLSRFE